MVLFGYGDFDYACRVFPTPICNLFFRQLLAHPATGSAPSDALHISSGVSVSDYTRNAGVGVNPECTIARMSAAGGESGVGNVANIVVCAIAVLAAIGMMSHAGRRIAAVGRREFIALLGLYAVASTLQLLDTGSFLRQGGQAITWITGLHVGVVVVFFWTLLWNGILGFQWVDDGGPASLVPWLIGTLVLGVGSSYIALDTGFHVTGYFASDPPASLHNAWLFSLTVVWPLVASFVYLVLVSIIVVVVLREFYPLAYFAAATLLFALGEAARYALWHKICTGTSAKVDGSFVATLLETMAMGALYGGWIAITEDTYSDSQSGFLV